MDQSQPGGKGDEELVLLKFWKVGDILLPLFIGSPCQHSRRLPSALPALALNWLVSKYILLYVYLSSDNCGLVHKFSVLHH